MGLEEGGVRGSYDRVAERYTDEFVDELEGKPIERALLGLVAEEVVRGGGGVVADLGAGPGQIGAFLRDRGTTVLALDLAPGMAAIARRRLGLPAVAGSLTALPVADGSLAAATAFYCLIHLDDAGIDAAAAELVRVLRPGGIVLVGTHVGDGVRHLDEWWGHPVGLDFRMFSTPMLVDRLSAAGLRVEMVTERAAQPQETTRRAYVLARAPA